MCETLLETTTSTRYASISTSCRNNLQKPSFSSLTSAWTSGRLAAQRTPRFAPIPCLCVPTHSPHPPHRSPTSYHHSLPRRYQSLQRVCFVEQSTWQVHWWNCAPPRGQPTIYYSPRTSSACKSRSRPIGARSRRSRARRSAVSGSGSETVGSRGVLRRPGRRSSGVGCLLKSWNGCRARSKRCW